jgi:hypothetical protein
VTYKHDRSERGRTTTRSSRMSRYALAGEKRSPGETRPR